MSMKRKPTNRYKDTDGEIPAVRWYNRRRLAWFSFYCLVGGTFIYWFALPLWFTFFGMSGAWLTIIGESYSWYASTLAVIVTGYMGIEYANIFRKSPSSPSRSNEDYETTDEMYEVESETVTEEIYDPEGK